MNEPHDPNLPPSAEGPNQQPSTPDERSRAERRRQLLRIGTAMPMVLTLRPGSTLAASDGCTSRSDSISDPDSESDPDTESGFESDSSSASSSTACLGSVAINEEGRTDVSRRPTLLAGRTGSSYAKYWLDQA